MADSDAHTGMGAQLQKGDGQSPENFVAVMGIKSISGPGMQRSAIDVTDLAQVHHFRQFIGGLVDPGEISFEANWLPRDPSQGEAEGGFWAEFDKTSCDSRGNWRITLPECEGDSDGYIEFAGIVTGMSFEIPMDDVMGFAGSIKISGRPNLVLVVT